MHNVAVSMCNDVVMHMKGVCVCRAFVIVCGEILVCVSVFWCVVGCQSVCFRV